YLFSFSTYSSIPISIPLAKCMQYLCFELLGISILRIKGQNVLNCLECLLIAPQPNKDNALVFPGTTIIGIECECLLTCLKRLLTPSQPNKNNTLVLPGVTIVEIEGECSLKCY